MRLIYIALISFFICHISYADILDFSVSMNGAQASTVSSGTGGESGAGCSYNTNTNVLTIEILFTGLSSNTNNAHIHGPADPGVSAGVVIDFTGFPLGVTSGTYSNTFSLSEAQEADLILNRYYINIHTDIFGGGEIRGQLINAGVVPVELSSFTAMSKDMDVILAWRTETEVDNYGFEVERNLKDGKWDKAGFVNGNGNSNSTKKYEYIDKYLSAGKYLYRLKQIDIDGFFEYSKEIEVEIGSAPMQFNLAQNYPNPFNPETVIEFTVPETGQTTLKVYDILGEEVITLFEQIAESGIYNQVRFDASNLATGIYIAGLQFGSRQMIKKMIYLK